MSIDEITKCLYQGSKHYINLQSDTHGDCRICTYHKDNVKCSGYYPIKVHRIYVKDPRFDLFNEW